MEMCRTISFRPTREMLELIEAAEKRTGCDTSEVMRTFMSEYMILVRKAKNYR